MSSFIIGLLTVWLSQCSGCSKYSQSSVEFRIHLQSLVIQYIVEHDSLDTDYRDMMLRSLYPDTILVISSPTDGPEVLCYKIDRRRSDSSTGFFVLKKDSAGYSVLGRYLDPASYDLKMYLVDFEEDHIPEVVSVWSDESVFFLTIHQVRVANNEPKLLEVFRTEDLGNPEIEGHQKLEIEKGRVRILYQNQDAEHKMFYVIFDKERGLFLRESAQQP